MSVQLNRSDVRVRATTLGTRRSGVALIIDARAHRNRSPVKCTSRQTCPIDDRTKIHLSAIMVVSATSVALSLALAEPVASAPATPTPAAPESTARVSTEGWPRHCSVSSTSCVDVRRPQILGSVLLGSAQNETPSTLTFKAEGLLWV